MSAWVDFITQAAEPVHGTLTVFRENDFILFRRNPACWGFRRVINLPHYDGESSFQSSGTAIHQSDPVRPVYLCFPLSVEFIGKQKWWKKVEGKRSGLSVYFRMFSGLHCVLGEVEPLCNLWLIHKCDPSGSQFGFCCVIYLHSA